MMSSRENGHFWTSGAEGAGKIFGPIPNFGLGGRFLRGRFLTKKKLKASLKNALVVAPNYLHCCVSEVSGVMLQRRTFTSYGWA